jgi:prefoldin subunit 5
MNQEELEYLIERNSYSLMEAESIFKTLSSIEISEENLRKMKQNIDRLKNIVDRCIKNVDSRGNRDGSVS